MPEVSVVIPTCGRPDYLRISIGSVVEAARAAGLSSGELSVVVVDDGHTACVPVIVAEALERSGIRGHCLNSPGGPWAGPAVARHHGISVAEGEFIYLLDDDDKFLPNRFLQSLSLLRAGEADVVMERSLRCFDDGSGRPSYITGPYSSRWTPFQFLLIGGPTSHITPGATAFRKVTYFDSGGYDPALRCYGEDGELLIRLCLYGRVVLLEGDPVCRISIHGDNTSRPANRDYWQNMLSLGTLHKKVRRERSRWPEAYRFLREGGVVSGKLDYCLSQIRHESSSVVERLQRGLWVIRYFPWDCIRWSNIKSICVWMVKGA